MPDDLATAAFDLSALSRADRRAILAALEPEERCRIEAAMCGAPAPTPAAAALHSAWFEGLSESADVSPAARVALAAAQTSALPVDQRRPAGRSLMQAAGGLLRR